MASINWAAIDEANKKATAQQPTGAQQPWDVSPAATPIAPLPTVVHGGPVSSAPYTPPPPPAPAAGLYDNNNPQDPSYQNPGYWDLSPSLSGAPAQTAPTASAGWWNPSDPQGSFSRLVAGKPANSQTLLSLGPQLQAAGITIEPANAAGASHKIRFPDGRVVRVGNYFDGGGAPSWGWTDQGAAGISSYMAQFNDPSTRLLEQYLQQQMGRLSSQQQAQEQANAGLRAKMPDIQAATDRLVAYLNQRATSLQGAPYTGTEQEILRTQALDPIERDRTAANKRALEQIGARGLTPESGIAMGLQNDVNSVFDRQRAGAQGDLAYKTINEQRSRQQEAQQLLGMVPQVQRAGATGDLQFLSALDSAVNSLGSQGINLATANQRLPSQAMNDALAVMGMGPGADSIYNQALGLYTTQNQQSQSSDYATGQYLAYLLGGGI